MPQHMRKALHALNIAKEELETAIHWIRISADLENDEAFLAVIQEVEKALNKSNGQ